MRHIVTAYRGTARGWVPCGSGRARLRDEAIRLAELYRRIDPRFNYRVDVLPVELPNFL